MYQKKLLKPFVFVVSSFFLFALLWGTYSSYTHHKSFASFVKINPKAFAKYSEKRGPAADSPALIESDEEMFKVELFEDWLSVTLQKKLIKPNSALSAIKVHLNAATGKIELSGTVKLPEDILAQGSAANPKKTIDHDFYFEIIPVVRHMEKASMLSIKISSFKLNGQEFIQTIPVVMSVLGIILSDNSLFDYFENSNPDAKVSTKDPMLRAKQFFEAKNVTLSTGSELPSITVKLRLDVLFDFDALGLNEGYEHSFADLRLWYFGPLKMKNKKANVFYMAAGYGLPSGWKSNAADSWVYNLKQRLDSDSKIIFESQKDALIECGNTKALSNELKSFYETNFKNMNVGTLEVRDQGVVKEFFSSLDSQIKTVLDPNDPDFASEPCQERKDLKKYMETQIVSLLSDIKKDQRIQAEIRKSTSKEIEDDRPFLVKRFSADTLASLGNSLRSVTFNDKPLFSEARLVLLPQLPGLALRGRLILDPKLFLPQSLLDKSDEISALYKNGVPFEMTLRLFFQQDGWVRLIPKSMTVFRGTKQEITFQSTDKNGQLMLPIVESTVVSMLKEFFNDPTSKVNIASLMKSEKGAIMFYLDPKVLTTNILKLRTSFKVWNVEVVYDKDLDRSYLELSLGKGARTQAYTDWLFSREEYKDSQRYDESMENSELNKGAPDLRAVISMPEFSDIANSILAEVIEKENAKVEALQNTDKVQTITQINDISLSSAGKDGSLKLGITISRIMRKKYKGIDPRGWGKDSKWYNKEDSLSVTAKVSLVTDSVDRLAPKLKLKDPELFAHHPALRVDLLNASVVSGTSQILKFLLSDVDLDGRSLGGAVKALVVKLLPHFQASLTKMGIDSYCKIVGYGDELVLILNPRLVTSSVEVNLIKNGVYVNSKDNQLGVDLGANLTMGEFAKAALTGYGKMAKEIVTPFVENKSLKKEAFENSLKKTATKNFDELLDGYLDLLKDYPRVAEILNQKSRSSKHWRLTECGSELMTFAWSAYQIQTQLSELINQAKSRGILDSSYLELVAKEKLLRDQIKPLVTYYGANYALKNKKFITLGNTPWNKPFMADATEANKIYEALKNK